MSDFTGVLAVRRLPLKSVAPRPSRRASRPGDLAQTVIRSPQQIQIIALVETAQPRDAAVLTVEGFDMEARRAQ